MRGGEGAYCGEVAQAGKAPRPPPPSSWARQSFSPYPVQVGKTPPPRPSPQQLGETILLTLPCAGGRGTSLRLRTTGRQGAGSLPLSYRLSRSRSWRRHGRICGESERRDGGGGGTERTVRRRSGDRPVVRVMRGGVGAGFCEMTVRGKWCGSFTPWASPLNN